MIDEHDLMEFSSKFRDIRQLERDYLLILLLREIYYIFTNDLIFNGGTTLKYFFNLNRFSEDLDFTFTGQNETSGRRYLNEKMELALNHFNVQYQIVERDRRGKKIGNNTVEINYEIRV